MVLWSVLFMLLVATLLVVLRPLFRPSRFAVGGEDTEVFAAQLDELEADRARGLIGERDAEAARTEIARRLLRARGGRATGASPLARRGVIAALVAVFVVAFSLGTYLTIGSPLYGDQPLAARITPMGEDDLDVLIARAEEELARNPEDGRGWLVIAPVYQRLGRFADAAAAYGNVNRILGETPQWLTAQAENLVYETKGEVGADAAALFERALAADPDTVRAAIFLAIAARQGGDLDGAERRWQALLDKSEGTEPWLEITRAEYARMDRPVPAAAAAPAPPAGNAGATPQMVEAMVASLAGRLAAEGGSVEEWVRLVRSYTVLGRTAEAEATVEAAMAALSGADREAFAAAPEVKSLTR